MGFLYLQSSGDTFKRPPTSEDWFIPLKLKRVRSCLAESSYSSHLKSSQKDRFLTDEYSSDEGMDLDGSFSECMSSTVLIKQKKRTSLVKCHSESAVTIMKAVEKCKKVILAL